MKVIKAKHFSAERVRLDGNLFLDYVFQNCTFYYGVTFASGKTLDFLPAA